MLESSVKPLKYGRARIWRRLTRLRYGCIHSWMMNVQFEWRAALRLSCRLRPAV